MNENITETEDQNLPAVLKMLLLLAGLSALIVGLIYFYNNGNAISSNHSRWGEFGDFFGGVLNPIFGFFGLMALLLTITLQAKELKLTRQELSNSSSALVSQNRTLEKNNFENSFFQMLRFHNEIVNSIDVVSGGARMNMNAPPSAVVVTKGKDCLRVFYRRLGKLYEDEKKQNNDRVEKEILKLAYAKFYAQHDDELGHYFRYLYNIFKFINNSEIEDKKFYSNLVRAQLSGSEQVLLHYNSMSDYSSEKFLPLLKEYSVLKSLPKNLLLDDSHASLGALE